METSNNENKKNYLGMAINLIHMLLISILLISMASNLDSNLPGLRTKQNIVYGIVAGMVGFHSIRFYQKIKV